MEKHNLKDLFLLNNLNYDVEYMVICLPKTCSTYIKFNLQINLKKKVFFTHSMYELINIDKRFENYNIKDIIDFILEETTYEKVFIIWSYREPQSRYISRYLWRIYFEEN